MRLKTAISLGKKRFFGELERAASRQLVLTGRLACLATRNLTGISSLGGVEFRVSSQWGEDGILDWLIERLEVPTHSFVEFGVEDYREANTRFLLENRNWRGLIIDGSRENIEQIKRESISWRHDLTAKCAFVTRENINEVIRCSGFGGEIGLLSIDIDGNDYWVWERIEAVNPIICVCEYNAVLGDVSPIAVPYDCDFVRTRKHYSNLYFGASIAALRLLAAKKGYQFVGTNSAGVNGFFVRNDYAMRLNRAIDDMSPRPSLARESRCERGSLTYISGPQRRELIASLPVLNVETGQTLQLGSVNPLYSEEWVKEMLAGSVPAPAENEESGDWADARPCAVVDGGRH
jgi:hypothetical protein